MRFASRAFALLLTGAVVAGPAAAQQVITFDDLTAPSPTATVYVPEQYKGYTFGGSVGSGPANCGFVGQCSWVTNLGTWQSSFPLNVSNPVSTWSNGAATSLTLGRATPFTFTSAYLGARFGFCPATAPSTTIIGSLNGTQVFSTTRTLACGAFQLEQFNWANIDLVQFTAPTPDANITVDDITVSANIAAVPEPATLALLAPALLGVGALARRRRA